MRIALRTKEGQDKQERIKIEALKRSTPGHTGGENLLATRAQKCNVALA